MKPPGKEGRDAPRQRELLHVYGVAFRLGLSVGFLERARRAGFGPPFTIVDGEIRYDWPQVRSWAAAIGLPIMRGPATDDHIEDETANDLP